MGHRSSLYINEFCSLPHTYWSVFTIKNRYDDILIFLTCNRYIYHKRRAHVFCLQYTKVKQGCHSLQFLLKSLSPCRCARFVENVHLIARFCHDVLRIYSELYWVELMYNVAGGGGGGGGGGHNPCDIIMHQWQPSLTQVVAWWLLIVRPLPNPIMTSCKFDT